MEDTYEDKLHMFPDVPLGRAPVPEGRVFVVQETDLNLVDATRFGELIALLPGRLNITMNPTPVVRTLRQKLRGLTDSDYILPVGDPIAIGLAFTVAADLNRGRFKALKWNKDEKAYYIVSVDIYDREK